MTSMLLQVMAAVLPAQLNLDGVATLPATPQYVLRFVEMERICLEKFVMTETLTAQQAAKQIVLVLFWDIYANLVHQLLQ